MITKAKFNTSEGLHSFELSEEDFRQYLKIHHFFLHEIGNTHSVEPSRITQILIDANNSENSKGTVGKLYEGLTSVNR